MEIFIIFAALFAYFFPGINAISRKHKNYNSIFLTNLFFGWTGLGWIISLIWSTTDNVRVT